MVTHGDVFERPAGTYDPRLTAFYRAVTPRAYKACDLVIALSPDMATWARRGGADPGRIAVIPNGVDVADLGFSEDEEPPAPPTGPPLRVLYVGRLAAEKGVGVLLRALCILRREGVEVSSTLVGGGAEAQSHASFIAESGLRSVVELAGPVSRSSLAPLFASHQVVCVPSLSDPLPTVVLEALALGRPVIGSQVGGIPSLVTDRVNGLLFPPGDASALADRLRELASSPDLARSLSAHARPSVLPRLSWKQVGQRLASTLSDLAAGVDRDLPLVALRTGDRSKGAP
jgi:glycosyltransferase involved in cell wall biosynthesis